MQDATFKGRAFSLYAMLMIWQLLLIQGLDYNADDILL